jgi:signal transduction histidine kinase
MCNSAPLLLYYVYVPTLFVTLLLGFFVFLKDKEKLSNRLFLLLSVVMSLWIFSTMMDWQSSDPNLVEFFSRLSVIGVIVPAVFLYFCYSFPDIEKLSYKKTVLIFLPILPFVLFAWSKFNILSIDVSTPDCEAIFGPLYYLMPIVFFLYCVWIGVKLFMKNKKGDFQIKKQIKLVLVGFILFMAWVTITNVIGPLLNFDSLSFIGPVGVIIFMFFIAYAMTKYHFLNIKVILAQTLVWALVILVGSQFFFIQTNINKILTGITLIISAFVGIMIVRSVKKEVALREELEIANNNQQALIHFISHQIKGFFTKSKMIFSGLVEGDFGEVNPAVIEMAKTGLASDNNAVAMVQDILGASNLKKGTTDYNFKLVDLTMIVNRIAENFKVEMEKKGLKFETDISTVPLPAMVDETQITQVFKNLMDNSLRYTPSGEIKVSLQADQLDKKKVLFVIKDTGVGLSDADKAKLFTEGGKGEESLKVNTNSTGYGLYIVKKIVDTHKGRIWAESAGRGHGSKFCVELPITA